jgi:hypothetical protein
MNEFPWMGAAFALGIVSFAVFMILNIGKNVSDDMC